MKYIAEENYGAHFFSEHVFSELDPRELLSISDEIESEVPINANWVRLMKSLMKSLSRKPASQHPDADPGYHAF